MHHCRSLCPYSNRLTLVKRHEEILELSAQCLGYKWVARWPHEADPGEQRLGLPNTIPHAGQHAHSSPLAQFRLRVRRELGQRTEAKSSSSSASSKPIFWFGRSAGGLHAAASLCAITHAAQNYPLTRELASVVITFSFFSSRSPSFTTPMALACACMAFTRSVSCSRASVSLCDIKKHTPSER